MLAALGFLDAAYMLAFNEGVIDTIACPFFGEGCAKVGRSPHAREFGVPHAAVGVLGYAVMTILALLDGGRPASERSWKPRALAAVSAAAVAASGFLTWKQTARVRAWCFWCITSSVLNAAIAALAAREAVRSRAESPA